MSATRFCSDVHRVDPSASLDERPGKWATGSTRARIEVRDSGGRLAQARELAEGWSAVGKTNSHALAWPRWTGESNRGARQIYVRDGRLGCRWESDAIADRDHSVVVVSIVVQACDPGRIGRTAVGKRNQREESADQQDRHKTPQHRGLAWLVASRSKRRILELLESRAICTPLRSVHQFRATMSRQQILLPLAKCLSASFTIRASAHSGRSY
jgi:hypothetical protein